MAPRSAAAAAANAALFATFGSLCRAAEYSSVAGTSLLSCSQPGTAMTGFTRTGSCVDWGDDDAGSHHICIEMKSDFCEVTGQPNWCVERMPCMGQSGSCPIGNWCVCQWAFAKYIDMAGGCENILDVVCDATNMAAFRAYKMSNDPSHKRALECIERKCNPQDSVAPPSDDSDALVQSKSTAGADKDPEALVQTSAAAPRGSCSLSSVARALVALAFLVASGILCQAAEYESVLGGSLGSCSKPGSAMTGFTRTGHCVDYGDDDAGSHHICIEMKSDFCEVTGQPNWCVEKMSCMGQSGKCPIGNWCVCQWAFARYLEMAGGCDNIVDLVCDATNMAAFQAYKKSDNPSHKAALKCIKRKCDILDL